MAKKPSAQVPLQLREFRSPEEIDAAVRKFQRRIKELEDLDVPTAVLNETGADAAVRSNVKATILEVFGADSPEFREQQYIRIWAGPEYINELTCTQIVQSAEPAAELDGRQAPLAEQPAQKILRTILPLFGVAFSGLQKRLHFNSCLAKDRAECALGEIPAVMRDGDLSSCL